jgi:hypothetical protein
MKDLNYFKEKFVKCLNKEQRDIVLEKAKQTLTIGEYLILSKFAIDFLQKLVDSFDA